MKDEICSYVINDLMQTRPWLHLSRKDIDIYVSNTLTNSVSREDYHGHPIAEMARAFNADDKLKQSVITKIRDRLR